MLKKVLLGLVAALAVVQLVPYGRNHANPPVATEPTWDKPGTRALAKRACFDCHSNETTWPGYSNIAPVSWLVQHDVDEGREHLNFSDWARPQRHAKDMVEEVREGEMPPSIYLPLHPEAKLSDAEKQALMAGLAATFAANPAGPPQ